MQNRIIKRLENALKTLYSKRGIIGNDKKKIEQDIQIALLYLRDPNTKVINPFDK